MLCFILYLRAISKNKPPGGRRGAYIWRGDLTEGFLWYEFEGLINIFGGLIEFDRRSKHFPSAGEISIDVS